VVVVSLGWHGAVHTGQLASWGHATNFYRIPNSVPCGTLFWVPELIAKLLFVFVVGKVVAGVTPRASRSTTPGLELEPVQRFFNLAARADFPRNDLGDQFPLLSHLTKG
jgi:hypothetical protein